MVQWAIRKNKQLVSEVNILRDLKHPHIVRYYDRIIDKENTKIFIIMEYCEGGDISLLIKKLIESGNFMPEDQIWKIFTQIVEALHECHNRKAGKILHRDIKPGNLFLDTDNNVKLGDFGLARIMGKESLYAYTNVGTPYYMSPEQINENKYNEKSDIWSTGWILYEIATLKPPFEATNQVALAKKINEGKIIRLPKLYSEELWRVISLMMHSDQEKRPSVQDLLNFPQVSLRLREKRLIEHYSKLKKREEDIKKKELKILKQENDIRKYKDKLKAKDKELEESKKIIEELQQRLSELEDAKGDQVDTPKPLGRRKSSIRDKNSRLNDSSVIYPNLKQEIKELTSKISYESTVPTRLKKQASCLTSKTDELSLNASCEREPRRSSGISKYKSWERQRRTSHTKISSQKPYDYKHNSRTFMAEADQKENIAPNPAYERSSREEYTTPPFRSYKAKNHSKENDRIRTTSYRSRSGITSITNKYKSKDNYKGYLAKKEKEVGILNYRREKFER